MHRMIPRKSFDTKVGRGSGRFTVLRFQHPAGRKYVTRPIVFGSSVLGEGVSGRIHAL